MPLEDNKQAVDAIAELARKAGAIESPQQIHGPDGRNYVVLPTASGGVHLHELEDEGRLPLQLPRIQQRADFFQKQSLVDYVNAFKTSSARLFAQLGADGKGGTITAVLDYHAALSEQPGSLADVAPLAPGRLWHIAAYTLRDSEEWTRWAGISSNQPKMTQHEFVRFLEENAADIVAPQGADILELARDFSAKRKVNFSQALRTQTGDVSFEYTVEAEAKSKSGTIDVPNLFRLNIPVFYGEPPMEVLAYLRFSIDDGLKLGIQLHRPVFIRQSLFELIGRDISEATGVPLHYGSFSSIGDASRR